MRAIEEYYDALAPTYDEDRFGNSYGRYIDRLERQVLRDWLRDVPASAVVDLGCGTGRLLEFARAGVDASAGMLAVAAARHPDRLLARARLDATGLGAASFDAAICFHVLMHLETGAIRGVLAEAARIVRPGGRLILDVPSSARRRLGRRAPSGWHGDTSASIGDLAGWSDGAWRVRRWRGTVFFPIHRVPYRWRPSLCTLDAWIGNSPLKRWSSYLVCELERAAR